jgi:hypothetical protein
VGPTCQSHPLLSPPPTPSLLPPRRRGVPVLLPPRRPSLSPLCSGGGGAWRGVVRHGRSSGVEVEQIRRGRGAPLRGRGSSSPAPFAWRRADAVAASLRSSWSLRSAPPAITPAFRRRERRWRQAPSGLLRLLPADVKHEAPEREIRSCLRRPHPPLHLRWRLGRRARRPWVRGPHATSLFP